MSDDQFVSKAWLGAIPFIGYALVGFLVAPMPHSGFYLALAVGIGLLCVNARAVWRPDISRTRAASLMRGVTLLQVVTGAVATLVLAVLGDAVSAILSALLGVALTAVCWPWDWTLRRVEYDRVRTYQRGSFVWYLVAGFILCGFSLLTWWLAFAHSPAPETSGVDTSIFLTSGSTLAIAAQMFVSAWDERRRPRGGRTPTTPPSRSSR